MPRRTLISVAHTATTLSLSGASHYSITDSWSPAVNVYQLLDRVEVCVDLAGIDKAAVDVRVEPGRLTIRGHRPPPEPREITERVEVAPTQADHERPAQPARRGRSENTVRVLAMEIDNGPFGRILPIPEDTDLTHVESRYTDGLLWVILPRRRHTADSD